MHATLDEIPLPADDDVGIVRHRVPRASPAAAEVRCRVPHPSAPHRRELDVGRRR